VHWYKNIVHNKKCIKKTIKKKQKATYVYTLTVSFTEQAQRYNILSKQLYTLKQKKKKTPTKQQKQLKSFMFCMYVHFFKY
jgi:hypothetical protein